PRRGRRRSGSGRGGARSPTAVPAAAPPQGRGPQRPCPRRARPRRPGAGRARLRPRSEVCTDAPRYGRRDDPTMDRFRVLIAGGGVAALEAALALRHVGDDRVSVTLIAPEPRFWYRPLAVVEPFGLGRVHGVDLAQLAD